MKIWTVPNGKESWENMLSSIPVFSSPKKRTKWKQKVFLFPYNGNTLVYPHPHHQWACLSLQLHNWPGLTRRWEYCPKGLPWKKNTSHLDFLSEDKKAGSGYKEEQSHNKETKLSLVLDLCCLLWKVFARGWEPKRADTNLLLIIMDLKGAFGKRA